MAAASIFQPRTSPTGSSWPGWRAPHSAIAFGARSSTQRSAKWITRLPKRLCEAVKRRHRREILGKVRRLEFGIGGATQIARRKLRIRAHAAGKEPAAQGSIGQHGKPMLAGIGKNIRLDASFEQIVGRLHGVERRHSGEGVHLRR